MLVTVCIILALSYWATRLLAAGPLRGSVVRTGTRHMRVLEQLPTGRDQKLLVVQAGGRFFLIGAAASGLRLLAELSPEEGALWSDDDAQSRGQISFREALLSQLKKK